MGFVSPFNSKVYASSFEKDLFIRVPIRVFGGGDLKSKGADASFELLQNDKMSKLFQYSTNGYTTAYDVLEMKPHKSLPGTRLVRPKPCKTVSRRGHRLCFHLKL